MTSSADIPRHIELPVEGDELARWTAVAMAEKSGSLEAWIRECCNARVSAILAVLPEESVDALGGIAAKLQHHQDREVEDALRARKKG